MTAGLVIYRAHSTKIDLSYIIPERVYTLQIVQSFSGRGEPLELSVYLPEADDRQRILAEEHTDGALKYQTFEEDGNRIAKWTAGSAVGAGSVVYTVHLNTKAVRYAIDENILVSDIAVRQDNENIHPTKAIQSDADEIWRLADSFVPKDNRAVPFLKAAFDYASGLGFKAFKGTTDALTAYRLGEASCNGKSRLLAAILRSKKIPARLVGGLVMTGGNKRTSHQWVEVRIGGRWIPMDPTNGHFAEIPEHYLTVYRGDLSFFKHSSDIGFQYYFSAERKMVPPQEIDESKQGFGFFAVFKKIGIDLDLLKSIIMIPLGGVIVVIFRNVIGLRTFGTFLPVLIAVACRNTGLFWGIVGFVSTIAVVSLLRHFTAKLQLLHSPQLGVLLTAVIGLLLMASVLGATFDLSGLAKVSLFPVVIITITSERFALMEIEEGRKAAWKIMAQSLLVVSVCYAVMQSLSLQILMLGFPELLLCVAAMNIWIGRWVGLRASEWLRFRWFFNGNVKESAA
jgi:hypothetical protein